MDIDWKKTQRMIGAGVDGIPGRETYGKLFAAAASRPFSVLPFERLGLSAARNFPRYNVLTKNRLLATIAETCHETQGFTRFEENLSYSAQRLAEVWPARYAVDPRARDKTPNPRALRLARRPEDLANDTYGLRMGNLPAALDNDEHPDGWQYRGRGPTMLTGLDNYRMTGAALDLPLVTNPDLAADPFVGLEIACEFYTRKGVYAAADRGDDAAERRIIQGGALGLPEVKVIKRRLSDLVILA